MGSRGASAGTGAIRPGVDFVAANNAMRLGEPYDMRQEAVFEINQRIAALGKDNYEKRRAKLVRQRQLLETTPVYSEVPKGWREIKGATTAPSGFKWISNGKSMFGGEREQALVPASELRR